LKIPSENKPPLQESVKGGNKEAENLLEVTANNGTRFKLDFPVNLKCWPNCAQNCTKVILVRHPLDRLLSAYLYIFDNNPGKFHHKVRKDVRLNMTTIEFIPK
jgi:hypothetical protein